MCAVAKDNTEIALCLAGKGADVNIKDNFEQHMCLLQDLVLKNYLQIVKRLIETGDDVNLCTGGPRNTSALHVAAEKCNLEILDCLIKAGVDLNAQDYDGGTPLVRAVISEKTKLVPLWAEECRRVNVKGGSDVNDSNFERCLSLLQDSLLPEKLQIMKRLIEGGADVNLCTGVDLSTSSLHTAAQSGNREIMDCLLEAGANLNVLDCDG
jgi:ankyrin repeat protein